ncbi:MAG: hypothetical protein EON88_29490 [Brevundimonas sp.]|nr:MAG: hypothetical protein EON88_29490 [Brevundimonas sp.]
MFGLEGRSGRKVYAAAAVTCWLAGPVGSAISRGILDLVQTTPDESTARLLINLGNGFGLIWTLAFTALFFVALVRRARDIGLPPLMTFIGWKVITIAEAATAGGWSPEVSTVFGDWRASSLALQIAFELLMIALPSRRDDTDIEPVEVVQPVAPPSQPLRPSSTRASFGLRQ